MMRAQPDTEQAALAGLVRALRALGVGGLAAVLLENSGPLSFLGAQALYFAAPVVSPFGAGQGLADWAALLEDPESVRTLASQLRAANPGTPR